MRECQATIYLLRHQPTLTGVSAILQLTPTAHRVINTFSGMGAANTRASKAVRVNCQSGLWRCNPPEKKVKRARKRELKRIFVERLCVGVEASATKRE